MRYAEVVIGGRYGDEGKGVMVDCLTSEMFDPLVVRFNGGGQAGHTVTTPKGKRHVFHHIGSGAFNLAPTWLTKEFVSNPLTFRKEFLVFPAKVFVDPFSPITTHWDMLINQKLEEQRAADRHGSCGMGIRQTIERQQYNDCLLHAMTLPLDMNGDVGELRSYLERMWHHYYQPRMESLLTGEFLASALERGRNKGLLESFIQAMQFFSYTTEIADSEILNGGYNIVFEGAQGLMLDMDNAENFPHVTPSKTGLSNVLDLLRHSESQWTLNCYYMTRSYTTRHGAGPLPYEMALPDYDIKDRTNIWNEFQHQLRFAPLNLDDFNAAVEKDFSLIDDLRNVQGRCFKVMTCYDQLPHHDDQEVLYVENGELLRVTPTAFRHKMNTVFDRVSTGPTRGNMAFTHKKAMQ